MVSHVPYDTVYYQPQIDAWTFWLGVVRPYEAGVGIMPLRFNITPTKWVRKTWMLFSCPKNCGVGKKIQFTNCIQLPYAMLYQPFSDLFVATNFEKKNGAACFSPLFSRKSALARRRAWCTGVTNHHLIARSSFLPENPEKSPIILRVEIAWLHQASPQTQSRDSFLALDGVTVAVSQVWTKHDKAVIGWQKRIKSEGLSRFPV